MIIDESAYLAHFGVKGMKWGQRKAAGGISPRTNREARKDAEEFTRAKLFYGEGAGTRRKLIKAKVEAKSKRDPNYKKAFDAHVSGTDLSKRAEQAKGQRRRKDAVAKTKKTTRGIKNTLTGNSQYASTAAIVLATGGAAAHKKGYDKAIFNAAKTQAKKIRTNNSTAAGRQYMKDLGFL